MVLFGVALIGVLLASRGVHAQTDLSRRDEMSADVRQKLSKRYSLDLRDASLLEALFAVRDVSDLNIVVGNEVTGTVNASYADTPVYDILDSLLITRGYGYRVVGGSLAVVPLASLGDQLPLFETEIIGLEHSNPGDLLKSIESMLSPEGRAHGVESSNSIVIIDYPKRITRIKDHIATLEGAAAKYKRQTDSPTVADQVISSGGPAAGETLVRVFQTQYVNPATLMEALTPLLGPAGRITAVELENKLVVSDDMQSVSRIEQALEQLDRPRLQVRIWALIYDCSTEDLERLGVNWSSGITGRGLIAATGAATQEVAIESVTEPISSGANGLLRLASVNRYMNMESIIQALNTADDSRLLADPNVVVMNHETAEIAIVTEVPYQQLTQGIEGGTIGTTEFREAGVTLNVVPHIADDETIALEVNPRFSLLTGFSETDNAPIIDRRETKTTVRVTNNQTIVLGGLRQRTRISELSHIPYLGGIPYVGKLFRHRSASTRESELLVFITPQIVLSECIGSARENCVNQFLESEIKQTPTGPLPYGFESVRMEQEAYRKSVDNFDCHKKKCQCEIARQGGACQCFEIPWDQAFQSEAELIEVGVQDTVSP